MKVENNRWLILGALFLAPFSSAHHGFAAHFDPENIIRIEGRVKAFEFINPHSFLYIDTQDEMGNPIVFLCDLQAKTQLLRRGVDETLFTVGETIVVEGFQARRDPLQCEFGVGHFADGSSFTMRSLGEASTQFALDLEVTPEEASLFGTWIRPGMNGDASGRGPSSGTDSITSAGLAVRDAFDPIADNPVNNCRGGSPVRTWGAPGLATSIFQTEGDIHIYHESMDITRVVHMQQPLPSADIVATDMGFSVGRFEGEDLVIETSNFLPGVITGTLMKSEQMTMQERLRILDNGRLEISWIVNEPLYYSEPIIGSQILQPTNQEIIPYECVPQGH